MSSHCCTLSASRLLQPFNWGMLKMKASYIIFWVRSERQIKVSLSSGHPEGKDGDHHLIGNLRQKRRTTQPQETKVKTSLQTLPNAATTWKVTINYKINKRLPILLSSGKVHRSSHWFQGIWGTLIRLCPETPF